MHFDHGIFKTKEYMKQARKSSEDAQAGYAQFEKKFGLGNLWNKKVFFSGQKKFQVKKVFWIKKGFFW